MPCPIATDPDGPGACRDAYTCCSCGGVECGCPYCWDCNACDYCLNHDDED